MIDSIKKNISDKMYYGLDKKQIAYHDMIHNEFNYYSGYADACGELLEMLENEEFKDIFDNLDKFRKDRHLDVQKFDYETFFRKSIEEDFEMQGYDGKYCKPYASKMARIWAKFRENPTTTSGKKVHPSDNTFVKLDGLADGIVYRIEAIEQLGFDARIVMDEVQKEINSREGRIVDGKFEKWLTPEAKAKWYKANFHLAQRM